MKVTIKKSITALLTAAMLISLITIPVAVAAEGDPVLEMSIANKIDVALAVGPTTVNYATFEADLRAALKDKPHPVPDEDIYIMATKAVSASTTSEFSWWTYDHTRPAATYSGVSSYNEPTHTYIEAPAAAATSTASATYLQNGSGVSYAPGVWGPGNPTTATTIVTTIGATNYVPGIGYQYADVNKAPNNYPIDKFEINPDPANPDLAYYNTTNTRRLYHPYQGNNTHMVSSNSGATMDFYGYPQYAFRDWQFLPNNQKTLKTFEFSIAEDRAFDALDGVGFFFNTEINGSYTAGTQTMSGYLLFLQYNSSGLGASMTIYKFKDVNTKAFHNTIVGTTSSSAQYTLAGYNGTANATSTTYKPQFVPVATSTIYTGADFSRRIRIEASPTQVKVYYNGSTAKNDPTVLDPTNPGYVELTEAHLVNFTTSSVTVTGLGSVALKTGESIPMDETYIGQNTVDDADYGFGPMAAYLAHGCARPTHIALQNLSMTVEKVKTLTEVVREPEWHENTLKYLVNLNEHTIEDFTENAVIAELLARLTNDDIYYVGWGATENAIASVSFLRKHSLKGTVIDIEPTANLATDPKTSAEWGALGPATQAEYLSQMVEALAYKAQIQAIADKIYERYWNQADDNRALTTDTVVMSVTGADTQNTADALWPTGKWMIKHYTDEETIEIESGVYMTNFDGEYPLSGQYVSDLEPTYTFTNPGLYEIFYRDVSAATLLVHRSPVAQFSVSLSGDTPSFADTSYDPDVFNVSVNGGERGIANSEWSWIDLDDPLMAVPAAGTPGVLIEDHSYMVTLTVTDHWGATNAVSRLVTYSDAISGATTPPYADFTITPVNLFIKTTDPEAQETQKITITNQSYDLAGGTITSAWLVYKDDVLYESLTEPLDITDVPVESYVVGHLPPGSYKITLVVTNTAGVESALVSRTFDIVEDLIKPSAAISVAAPEEFTGNTSVTLTFSDDGGSGLKESRYAIVTVGKGGTAPAAPDPEDAGWKLKSSSASKSVLVNSVGDNYIFWEAWDNAGNYNNGVYGPYTMKKKDANMSLSADPQDGSGSIYGVAGKGVTLTVTFTVDAGDDMPVGTVIFYQGSVILGGAVISAAGEAVLTCDPASWGAPAAFSATYGGDANYSNDAADDTCNVAKNSDATVSVGAQMDRTYNAAPFEAENMVVTGASYKIEYVGTGSTVYAKSETAPTDAGTYSVIVTTDDENFVEKSAAAAFEIYPRELALTLEATPAVSVYDDTVTLSATIANLKETPVGYLEFYVDDVLKDTVYSASFVLEDYDAAHEVYTYSAQTSAWSSASVGDHDLRVKYVDAAPFNYCADDFTIEDYNVGKANQTISFIGGDTVDKIYGDADFTVKATGGYSIYDIEYELISGSSVVETDVVGGVVYVTITGAGEAVIRATKPDDSNYNSTTADITIYVAKKTVTFAISLDDDEIEYGEDIVVNIPPNESGGVITYEYVGTGSTVYGPSDTPPTDIGTYTVTVTCSSTANYNEAEDSADFEIVPCTCLCDITLTFTGTTITIPFYETQEEYTLPGSYVFVSCGNPKHVDSFTTVYELSPLTPPGIADLTGGALTVNNDAVGETITITYTATHIPTGYVASKTAAFDVVKGTADPPVADFTISPVYFVKSGDPEVQETQQITLEDESYDPVDRDIGFEWEVFKDSAPFSGLSIDGSGEYTVGDLPPGLYEIKLTVTNDGGLVSIPITKSFTIHEDLIKPEAAIAPTAPKTFDDNSDLTLTFSDTGGSGYKENRYAIITVSPGDPAPSAPASGSPDWKLLSPAVTRTVTLSSVGVNYVFWEAWDNYGNYNSGVFGPYTMNRKEMYISLSAGPQDSVSSIYNVPGNGVTLTATLTVKPGYDMPTGTVAFYQETEFLGNASVDAYGVATFTGNPVAWGNPAEFTAKYSGDSNYLPNTDDDVCVVEKNPYATASVEPQTNKTYDAEEFIPTGITVTGTTYKVEYEGAGTTVYARSATAPVDAGTYTVIVTTNDSNYVEASDEAAFEIYPRELALTLEASPAVSVYDDTVTLAATISNAKEVPAGCLEFYVDGVLTDTIDSAYFAIEDFNGSVYTFSAQTSAWVNADVGDHELTLVFVPDAPVNYIADDYTIEDYNVSKADQSINFLEGAAVDKVFGDPDFTVTAIGGLSIYDIEYSVVSGSAIIEISVASGEATVTITGAGEAIIRATSPGDENYNAATADIAINITKKTGSFSIAMPVDSIEYGEDVIVDVSANEGGGVVTYEYVGTGSTTYGPSSKPPTAVGTYKVIVSASESPNYLAAEDSLPFSIVPCTCACEIIPAFDGTTIVIPYYAFQNSLTLSGGYELISCGNPRHVSSFTVGYELSPATATGVAAIRDGKLIVNDNAVGESITVIFTVTHIPTGYVETTYAVFEVEKAPAPASPPGGDGGGSSGVGGSGGGDSGGSGDGSGSGGASTANEEEGLDKLDKNDDDTYEVDVSSIGTTGLTVTYEDGPDGNADMKGEVLGKNVEYVITGDDTIELTSDFIDSLYAGMHQFKFNVNGKYVIYNLYIAPGLLTLQVNSGATNIDVDVDEADDFKETEFENVNNQKLMAKGYNVWLSVNIQDASDPGEIQIIGDKKGSKIIGAYFDIELEKIFKDGNGLKSEHLSEINDPIKFTIEIPENIRGFRNYVVARAHTPDGGGATIYDLLPTTKNGNMLTFTSDKFSTFAILYDKGATISNPIITNPGNKGTPGDSGNSGNSGNTGNSGNSGGTDSGNSTGSGNGQGNGNNTGTGNGQGGGNVPGNDNGPDSGNVPGNNNVPGGGNDPGGNIGFSADSGSDMGNDSSQAHENVQDALVPYAAGENGVITRTVGPAYLQVSAKLAGNLETGNHISYINGYGDGTVHPDGAITRAEVAMIFYRLLKNNGTGGASENYFNDVDDGAWYAQAVNHLALLGVLHGYNDGTFRPNHQITRAEFAVIAARFDDLSESGGNPFPDIYAGDWAFDSILSAYSKGWVDGYPDGTFRPSGSITRAEVIMIVNRMLGRMLDVSGAPDAMHTLYSDLHTDHWAFADVIEASVWHEYTRNEYGYEIWDDVVNTGPVVVQSSN